MTQVIKQKISKKHLIKDIVAEGLITQNPRTSRFYTKPKIHKEGIPGRPVISWVNCHSSKISEYVDYHLQPIVREIPPYNVDTSDFLRKLKSITKVSENSYLETLDVKSLYTSIPNSEGIKAVKISHESFTKKTIATKVTTTFLALILTLNNFILNSENFLQTKGCALVTVCALSYANIFIDHFERKYIYPLTEGKSLTNFRYIDDIFLIWTRTKNELDKFFKDLNKNHLSIKFDYKASKDRIVFLDTEIYLHKDKLHTEIYRKETERKHYLHIKCEHPNWWKDSLPYSQAIRIKWISSNQVDLNNSLKEMKNNFIKQGYHPSLINEHLERISLLSRIDLITKKVMRKKSGRILLVIIYNRFLPNIIKTIRKNWNIV